MYKQFKIGSDPEVFLRNSSGKLVSAIGVIHAGKRNPMVTQHGSIQQDNVLAEFNSMPAASLDEFIENHKLIISDLNDYISPMGLVIDVTASYRCPELLSDPESWVAGCDPDFNAWTGNKNSSRNLSGTDLRVAGGHLHISIEDIPNTIEARIDVVKSLDLILGVQSVIDDNSTSSRERKTLYGKAGSFRPKFTDVEDPYDGLEYRTLSNYWLKSDKIMEKVYRGVETALSNVEQCVSIANKNAKLINRIINSTDEKLAQTFINNHKEFYA